MQDTKLMVDTLKHIQKYHGMYFFESLPPIDNFLAGFFVALRTFTTLEANTQVYEALLKKHGLVKNRSLTEQFQEKGLSTEEATQAVLAIHIEVFEQS